MNKQVCMVALLSLATIGNAQENETVSFDASYTGDVVGNLTGGIETGATYLGYATMGVGINTEKLWKGGNFYIGGGNTHGGEPTAEFIGDLNVVDNIEAGNHTFLTELWYKQNIKDVFDFTIGQQDLNADFATCEESSLFIHSAQGINAVFAGNVSAPLFPLMGLGLQVGFNFGEHIRWQTGIFDGEVTDFDSNPYNVKWKFDKNEGMLVCSEVHYMAEKGTYKAGVYYHSNGDKIGFYTIGEQRIKNLGLFAQVAFAPKKKNESFLQASGGINFYNLFSKNDADVLGLTFLYNGLDNEFKHESICELTYKYNTRFGLFIQPDFQYVINPAGTVDESGNELDNALVAILRFGWEL